MSEYLIIYNQGVKLNEHKDNVIISYGQYSPMLLNICLLYTSDAADE